MGQTAAKQADKPITTIQVTGKARASKAVTGKARAAKAVTHILAHYWVLDHNRLCIKPVCFRLSPPHPIIVDKNN